MADWSFLSACCFLSLSGLLSCCSSWACFSSSRFLNKLSLSKQLLFCSAIDSSEPFAVVIFVVVSRTAFLCCACPLLPSADSLAHVAVHENFWHWRQVPLWKGLQTPESRGAYHLHKPPRWKCCAQPQNYTIWRGGKVMRYKVYSKQLNRLKGVQKLHRLKSQPTFSEAFQTELYEPFDFPIGISGFPM